MTSRFQAGIATSLSIFSLAATVLSASASVAAADDLVAENKGDADLFSGLSQATLNALFNK